MLIRLNEGKPLLLCDLAEGTDPVLVVKHVRRNLRLPLAGFNFIGRSAKLMRVASDCSSEPRGTSFRAERLPGFGSAVVKVVQGFEPSLYDGPCSEKRRRS